MDFTLKRPGPHLDTLTRIFKDTSIAGMGEAVFLATTYASNLLISRFLGATGVGIYAQAMAVILSVALVARLGVDTGLLKFLPAYVANQDVGYIKGFLQFSLRLVLLTSLVSGVIVFAVADLISNYIFHEPQMSLALRVLAITLPFTVLGIVGLNIIQAFNRTDYRVLISKFIIPLSSLGSLALLLNWGWRWSGLLISILLTAVVGGMLVYYVCCRLQQAIPGIEKAKKQLAIKEWLYACYPLLVSEFLVVISSKMTLLVLGYFQSSAEVGIYEIALKITLLIQTPLQLAILILAPTLARIYSKGDMNQLQTIFKATTKWIFTVSLLFFLIITLLGQSILEVFGSEFSSGQLALSILAIGYLVNVSTGAVGWMLIISNHLGIHMFNSALSAILTGFLSFSLIPSYGIIGAAISVCLVEIMINLIRLIEVLYLLKIHPYQWSFLKPVMAGLLTVAAVYFTQKEFFFWFPTTFWLSLILMVSLIFTFYSLFLILSYSEQLYKL